MSISANIYILEFSTQVPPNGPLLFREKVSSILLKRIKHSQVCVFEARPLYSQQKGTDITDHGRHH